MCLLKGLAKRQEFSNVYNNGDSVVDRLLVLYCLSSNHPYTRVGFSVGKKLGKAVIRNRYKRILREICRTNQSMIKDGYDFIIIARPRIVGENYHTIEKSVLKLAKKAKILERDEAIEKSGNHRHQGLSESTFASKTKNV